MRISNWIVVTLTGLLLAACGGGGSSAGTSPFGSGSTTSTESSSAQTIDVLSSAPQIGSASTGATITAIVKGAGNVALADTAVVFSSDTGTLTGASATTDSSGVATVTLTAGANPTNRLITVTATSGSATGSVQVAVTGTSISVAGPTTVALGNTTTMTLTATDSTGAALSGLQITATSSLGNGLSASTVTTSSAGVATLTYTASTAGTDTVTFTGGGDTKTQGVIVTGEDFVFTAPATNANIPVGTQATITVRYRSGGVPQAGRTVNFAATAGTVTPASAVTDSSGVATATISSATASPATLQASLLAAGGTTTVALATLPIEFVAVTPAKLVLQVSPGAIGPNAAGSTTNQAKLVATVTDANANPVKGVSVNFNRVADPSGGNLSQASAITDSSGQASVQYIAGALATATNGVQISATVASTSVTGSAALTVNQSALFIALGTGNVISNLDDQTYKKDWVVYVTDANGVAVPNVNLTVRVLPQYYYKGSLVWGGTVWGRPQSAPKCSNEDTNYNGILDPDENDSVDDNANGTLEPGNVISVTPGTVTTDSNGRATISLIYAESYAPWVNVTLRVQAVVSGTESSKEATFDVSGAASDFTDQSVPPAGVTSPFGVNACSAPD